MSSVPRHYVLAAGGTGGHLIPAFALAAELLQRGHPVALITDERGATIPGKPDYLTSPVLPPGRIAGLNPLGWLMGAKCVLQSLSMAWCLFDRFPPSAVVGLRRCAAVTAFLVHRIAPIP